MNAFRDALAQRRPQDQVELRTPAALAEGMVFADDTRLLLLGPEALAWRLRQHRAPPTWRCCSTGSMASACCQAPTDMADTASEVSAYSGATRRRPASSAWRA